MTRRRAHAAAVSALLAAASHATLARADMTKAECVERNTSGQHLRIDHKLAAAREQLRACADPSCPGLVRQDCAQRLQELDAAQPTIVFDARNEADQPITEVRVTMDGALLVDRLDGSALAIDPGAHDFTFQASPGGPVVTRRLVVEEGEKRRKEHVSFAPPAPAPAPAFPASAPPPSPAPPPAPPEASRGSALPVVAFAVGGAALATGIAFSLVAHGKRVDGDALCPGGTCPASAADRVSTLNGQATAFGGAAIASYVVGGAGLASGVALLFLGRREPPRTARLVLAPGPVPAGLGVVVELR